MARRIGLRMTALAALLGATAAVVETVHRTLHLAW
jgi:hypothetical protein